MDIQKSKKRYYDFVGMRKVAAICSTIMVIVSLCLFFIVGPTWGIDFTGGTEVIVQFSQPVSIDEIKKSLASNSENEELSKDLFIQNMGTEGKEFAIRLQNPEVGTKTTKEEIVTAVTETFGNDWIVGDPVFLVEVEPEITIQYSKETARAEIEKAIAVVAEAKINDYKADENKVSIVLPGQISKITNALKNYQFGELSDESSQQKYQMQNNKGLGSQNQFFSGKEEFSDSYFGIRILQTDSVGPKVGGELRRQGVISILFTLALILVYVAFRFNLSFAPGAVLLNAQRLENSTTHQS